MFVLCACAVFLIGSHASHAEGEKSEQADLSAIPPFLINGLSQEQTREGYITGILQVIRNNAQDRINLTLADINRAKKLEQSRISNQRASQLIVYDINRDTVITEAEIKEYFLASEMQNRRYQDDEYASQRDQMLDNRVRQVMRSDTDGDGKITYAEMFTNTENPEAFRNFSRTDPMEEALKLDPDKDGKLSVDELEGIARKTFYAADTNHDSLLSRSEAMPILAQARNQREQMENRCPFPKIPAGAKTVFVRTQSGQALSNAIMADSGKAASLVEVDVSGIDGPAYLMLASMEPVIWTLKGDAKNIAGVALSGPNYGENRIPAGVTGVEKAKVTYLDTQRCFKIPEPANPASVLSLKNRAKELLGKDADIVVSEASLQGISLSKDGVKITKAQSEIKTPHGFDENYWKLAIERYPAGFKRINTKDVIASMKVESQTIPAGEMGLSMLVGNGTLKPFGSRSQVIMRKNRYETDTIIFNGSGGNDTYIASGPNVRYSKMPTGFKIVKPVDTLPLTVRYGSDIFVLGKNLPLPKNVASRVCIFSEETRKPLTPACGGREWPAEADTVQ